MCCRGGFFVVLTLLVAGGAWMGSSYLASAGGAAPAAPAQAGGWQKGKGWGWIWGKDDTLGALNSMNAASIRDALKISTQGKVYDLGIPYSRRSYKWPGHSPGEVLSYRTPEGVKRQKDHAFTLPPANSSLQAWHSCALFMNDNVATQIDGLAHITIGTDNHWYNGFKEEDWGGNFGVRKCDAANIPPIIARGVMLDIAALKGVKALPSHYAITPADVDAALARQKVELRLGDVVLFRTGTLQFWGEDGDDHAKIGAYDSAGINLATAKYLIEEFGTMLIGSDTSGLEVSPAPKGSDSFVPVHKYLLVEQGVHIGEFHYLEDLSRDQIYEFCYSAVTNKIVGTTAGFTLRPLALR